MGYVQRIPLDRRTTPIVLLNIPSKHRVIPDMPDAKRYDRQNSVFSKAQTGVAANHSSATPSTDNDIGSHAQTDAELQGVPPPQDPNLRGTSPTTTPYTWLAGKMDGWRENDDYRTYFEQSRGANGMLVCDAGDGDYDDNGGYPTATGTDYGIHGAAGGSTNDGYGNSSFPLGPVVVRRV